MNSKTLVVWDEVEQMTDEQRKAMDVMFEHARKHGNVHSLSAPATIGDFWKRFEAKEDESNGL